MKEMLTISSVCLLLSGCGLAGNTKALKADEPQATLRIGQELALNQAINGRWFDNLNCEKGENSGVTGIGWLLGNNKVLPIPAEKTIYISETLHENGIAPSQSCGSNVCIAVGGCETLTSFTPKNGHNYAANLLRKENKCQTAIFEIINGNEVLLDEQTPLGMCK